MSGREPDRALDHTLRSSLAAVYVVLRKFVGPVFSICATPMPDRGQGSLIGATFPLFERKDGKPQPAGLRLAGVKRVRCPGVVVTVDPAKLLISLNPAYRADVEPAPGPNQRGRRQKFDENRDRFPGGQRSVVPLGVRMPRTLSLT